MLANNAGPSQQQAEAGAAGRHRLAGQRAAMRQRDLAGEAQPDAGAFGLGGKERQEDILAQRFGDAGAIVDDIDGRAAALERGGGER